MTALCGGGTSAAKPNSVAVVAYSSGLIAELLETIGSPWLIPVIPLLVLPPINLPTFCASDPPSMPVFTSAEALALVTLQFGTSDFNSGVSKLNNVILAAAWPLFCECTGGTAVPTPTGPTAPSGTPQIQLPSSPGIAPCVSTIFSTTSGDSNGTVFTRGGPILTGLTAITATATMVNKINTGTGAIVRHDITDQGASGILATHSVTLNPGETKTINWTVASGANSISDTSNGIGGTGNSTMTNSRIDVFCSGSGSPIQTSQCAPDPNTQALLQAILTITTLIQRQIVPFSYISGATHLGLTGTGELTLQGVLGVKITPTSTPASAGLVVGDPDTLWLDSWINWGNADGWTERQFLTNSPFVSMPRLASQFTKLGYSLRPSLTVDIVELVREF